MSDNPTPTNAPRVFQIGTVNVHEDETTAGLSNDQVREVLKRTYPEVANATIRETLTADGTRLVSYLAQAGRKG